MTNQPSKLNPSSILQETRQHKGISLEMVHEATKIPLDALKAIEQGYSVHRLPPFYYRGFIRIYSKYLELDETKVLQSYGVQETAAPRQPQPVAPKEFKPKSRLTPQAVPADNFVKDTLKPLLKRNLSGPRLAQIAKFVVLLICIVFAFKIAGCMMHKAKAGSSNKKVAVPKVEKKQAPTPVPAVKSSVKEKSKPKKDDDPAPKSDRVSVEKLSAVAAVAEDVQAKVQESKPVKAETKPEAKIDKNAKRIELTVRATKSGWLQVNADGQVVFQSTLKKGAAETWSASNQIELSGKNINLLEFELNGKLLGALGPSDRGAKRVVFTKDGLSVKK